jgi:hypothetical protein
MLCPHSNTVKHKTRVLLRYLKTRVFQRLQVDFGEFSIGCHAMPAFRQRVQKSSGLVYECWRAMCPGRRLQLTYGEFLEAWLVIPRGSMNPLGEAFHLEVVMPHQLPPSIEGVTTEEVERVQLLSEWKARQVRRKPRGCRY